MFAQITTMMSALPIAPVNVAMLGVGLGAFMLVYGIASNFARRDPVLRRLEATGRPRNRSVEAGLLTQAAADTTGLAKVLVPTDEKERTRVRRQLAQAGFSGAHALRNYYLIRLVAGVLLPLLLVGLIAGVTTDLLPAPNAVKDAVAGLSRNRVILMIGLLVGVGFFGPAALLARRSRQRHEAIRNAFPNTLDLLQVSVEAGLGLDAAIVRVANEIMPVAPEIATELLTAEREIQAGRNREQALLDMADRTQVEEVRAFVTVVLQSARYGVAISEVLNAYAREMRAMREFKAQEMANKLPVKMSAVLASLMMPVLLIVSVGPVVIRYIRMFG